LGQQSELITTVRSDGYAGKIAANVILPEGLVSVQGATSWLGDFAEAGSVEVRTLIALTKVGNWTIEARAGYFLTRDSWYGDIDRLYFYVTEDSAYITKAPLVGAGKDCVRVTDIMSISAEPDLPSQGTTPKPSQAPSPASPGTLVVTGQFFNYISEDSLPSPGNVRSDVHEPMVWGGVRVWRVDGQYLGGDITGPKDSTPEGRFAISVENPGSTGFYVEMIPYTGAARIMKGDGSDYSSYTPVFYPSPSASSYDVGNWRPPDSWDYMGAWRIYETIVQDHFDRGAWDFLANEGPAYVPPEVSVKFPSECPSPGGGTCYDLAGTIYVNSGDYTKALDVVQHEYAHFIMQQIYGGYWPPNAGGYHEINRVSNINMAWTEGWADSFPLLAQSYGRWNDPAFEWGQGSQVNLETPTWGTPNWDNGEQVEGHVAGTLWDIFDNTNEVYDTFADSFLNIWDVIHSQTDDTFYEYFTSWNNRGHDSAKFRACAYQNTIDYGFNPSYPTDKWERIWYVYSGSTSSPWSSYLGHGPDEASLNFNNDWGTGIVAYSRSDMIGFVSSRTVNMAAGTWTFTVVSDDGVRLYLDGQLVIDAWKVQAPTTYTYTRAFDSAGSHQLRLEWFENEGGAKLSYDMQPEVPPPTPSYPSDRWERLWYVYSGTTSNPWGQYLGSGPDEPNRDFDKDWGSGTVAYSRSDRVGFISSRTVSMDAGSWIFTVVSDDGVRFYVDDQLVIDAWKIQAPTTYTYAQTFASTSDHRLRLEWFENEGGAKLSFKMEFVPPPPTPSYPSDRWERLWHVYSGTPSNPWSQYLGTGSDESNLVFDNNWGSGALAYGRSDRIGFISSRTLDMTSEKWTFTVVSDDGVRLYIDDQLVIDAWKVQPPTTYTYTQTFASSGSHRLRLEYFENEYGAKLSFNMQSEAPPPTPSYPSDRWERLWYVYTGDLGSPWGQYLGNGPDEPSRDFTTDWGQDVLAYGRSDHVGFVSSRTVDMASGKWTFTVVSDDGVRLYIDGELVIDAWKIQPPTAYTYTRTFDSAGSHQLRLEYFENQYGAKLSLDMQVEAPPPTPSYPSDRWERLWYVYSGSTSSPWGQYVGSGPDESSLTFDTDWGTGMIAYGRSDYVGFISSRTVNLASGTWTFTVVSDDGVRLYVDDQLVIDGWKVQPPTTYTYTATFSSTADHRLRLEWFENEYGARASFDMQPVGAEVGLKGEYYSSSSPGTFTTKIMERTDSTVNFDWGSGSPGSGVPSDLFAVRWTGSLTAPTSGTYTIYVTADDGVRVWIDGNLVIDAWKVQPPTEYSWTGPLSAGKHTIKIEYYENTYGAVMKLGWTTPGGTKVYPIPSSYLSPT
jgi:hypothetical protein